MGSVADAEFDALDRPLRDEFDSPLIIFLLRRRKFMSTPCQRAFVILCQSLTMN